MTGADGAELRRCYLRLLERGWIWRFLIVGLAAIATGTALGQTPTILVDAPRPQFSQLSRDDWINVRKIEDYLNNIKTAHGRFRRVNPDGSVVEGYFYIWRPGRIRVECDPPVPILIVSDGLDMIDYDRQRGQLTRLPLRSAPLVTGLLTSDKIALGDAVIGFEQRQDTFRLTLGLRDDPNVGSQILVFDPNPIRLKMWSIIDYQGLVTKIALTQVELNIKLDQDLFNIQFVLDHFFQRD